MQSTHLERQRSGLIPFLALIVMLILGAMVALTYSQPQGKFVAGLGVAGLAVCLYVIARDRALRRQQGQLVEEVERKESQVKVLGRKLKAEEVRTQELTAFYRAITKVSSNTDHRRVYETVLKAAIELVGGNCGSILMLDERGELRFVSTVGLDSGLAGLTQRKGRGLAGWVAEKHEPVLLVAGREQDERLKDPMAQRAENNIAISVPLVAHGDLLGVLNLGNTEAAVRDKLDEFDLRYAHLFAHHASIAIENADLVELKRGLGKPTPARV